MAKGSPLSLRLPSDLLKEIQKEAKRASRPTTQIIEGVLEEGIRMRRCPGIVFTEGPAGRRATVAGSGIDVWEVVRVYKACKKDLAALASAFPQLSRPQLQAALYYYRIYPAEIEDRLKSEEEAYGEISSQPFMRSFRS